MKQLEIKRFFKNHKKEKVNENKKNIDLKKFLKFLFNIKNINGIKKEIK